MGSFYSVNKIFIAIDSVSTSARDNECEDKQIESAVMVHYDSERIANLNILIDMVCIRRFTNEEIDFQCL